MNAVEGSFVKKGVKTFCEDLAAVRERQKETVL